MNNKPIVIIGAMDCEIQRIIQSLENPKILNGQFKIFEGQLYGQNIVIVKCGVGKSAAAMTTQYMIDQYNPKYIINSGIAGGINPNLTIYDIVAGERFIQHDFDASALGYTKGYMCTGIEPNKPTIFYSDKTLLNFFIKNTNNISNGKKVISGTIVSGDMFISSNEKKKELRKMFNADAVEMEATAITQVANFNKIPCLVVRIIADLADNDAAKTNKTTEKALAEHSATVILKFIKLF